ncbi:MAG: carboxypeptidase-like regulatory domain-containing protein [Allomuricauda sp.]
MKKFIFIWAIIVGANSWAQSKIEGFIYDEATNDPLPYCTIKIYGANVDYTITNEDGKFAVDIGYLKDSLEIRHLGFKPKKEAISYFKNEPRLYLQMDVSTLDEVVLTAGEDKEYPYRLLANAIEKYRKLKEVTTCKAFLKLTSSARNIPIEQLEGFYNGKQSLSEGIMDLKVKSGRFGQNKLFAFYSLDNTRILSDFQLFETKDHILPNYPGNMNYEAIKRKYNVRIDDCSSCSDQEVSVSFFPKRPNGRLFYGKILLDHGQLLIKKIELGVNEPNTEALSSINDNVNLTPMEIQLDVAFDPLNIEKIQYLNLGFRMKYQSKNASEVVDSKTFLYFYDYDTSFEEPYFTKAISFGNDYDRIVAQQTSEHFWESNYQFPKSFKDERSMEFMKKNGYLINYDNNIPLRDIVYAKPSVLSWQKDNRLTWEHLIPNTSKEENKAPSGRRDLTRGKAYDSPLQAHMNSTGRVGKKEPNITYVVDSYSDKEGGKKIVSRTLLDMRSSQFSNEGGKNKLAYINMMFDIYEVYRQLAASRITDAMTFDEAKTVYDEIYNGAAIEVKKMEKETGKGTIQQGMVKWNNKIKTRLGIDNLMLEN